VITVSRTINQEDQTVTWRLTETEPEHQRKGIMCHAVEEAMMTPELKDAIFWLGYQIVAAEPSRYYQDTPLSLTYYLARPCP
jgi:hypothetical protein